MNLAEKAVLISINPKWCELIFNGEKTMAVRKPGLETAAKIAKALDTTLDYLTK